MTEEASFTSTRLMSSPPVILMMTPRAPSIEASSNNGLLIAFWAVGTVTRIMAFPLYRGKVIAFDSAYYVAAGIVLGLWLHRRRDLHLVVYALVAFAIGGSFRINEILQETGCWLIEVGTTNRTQAVIMLSKMSLQGEQNNARANQD